jgi:hypothetical protein
MNVCIDRFSVHKGGNAPEENDDAAWPNESGEDEHACVRVAVADGATECIFAGRWARELVSAFGAGKLAPHNLQDGLAQIRDGWREWFAGVDLAWYAEEKARLGTFATLLALELTDDTGSGGTWQAAAVGDSCLFQVREEEVVVRFPLEKPEDFDSRPHLLGTISPDEKCLNEKTHEGGWQSGDAFYLMTDALACWFLKDLGERGGRQATRDASAITDEQGFRTWVQAKRDEGTMRNDDCTFVRVTIR